MKRALVTGGSRGIGKAIAERFSHEGLEVVTPSRQILDLSSPASVEEFLSDPGNCEFDIVVNNAGENIILALEDVPADLWRQTYQVNLHAPTRILQAQIPHFKKTRWGRVVNVASVYGMISRPGRANYSASKAALISITRSAALELGEHGVLINAVCPGFIETDLTRQNNSPQEIENLLQQVPLKKLGQPDDVAEVVSFLCSPKNRFITGQAIVIDGGFLAG